ncbi:helix-turn-helix transcriptional regulator [Halarchaeum nitratireducens]|uniref:Uncharacterized protein n=2 Tax=Halarchaeum nitratireducens TaxID=489913 RepID=A0A830GEQ6_9EURY|nr:hypothetical protein GCM10009021_27030 [Halarchaeum nitratireducens]
MESLPKDLVAALQTRHDMLTTLCTNSHTKADLEDILDTSRSTVNRGIRTLQDVNLVTRNDGCWQATPLGHYIARTRTQYLDQLSTFEAAAPLFEQFDQGDLPPDEFFRGATVYRTETLTPSKVMAQFIDHATDGHTLRFATPSDVLGHTRELYDQLRERDGYDFELIVPKSLFEPAMEVFPEFTRSLVHDDATGFYQGEVPFSFAVWIVDDACAGVLMFTDYGIAGLLVSTTSQAVAWANDQYQSVKDNASEIFFRGESSAMTHTGSAISH